MSVTFWLNENEIQRYIFDNIVRPNAWTFFGATDSVDQLIWGKYKIAQSASFWILRYFLEIFDFSNLFGRNGRNKWVLYRAERRGVHRCSSTLRQV